MKASPIKKPERSNLQHNLSLFLLGLLVVIAVTVTWIQNRYDPSRWRERAGETAPSQKVQQISVKGVSPLSAVERYRAENLSDKINGKADLYLNAGFKSLESRRFSLPKDKSRWMERYIYDMGGHPNAFSVFSTQRRSEGLPVDITPHAYLSDNGLFLVHGPYYLEIIASEASEEMQAKLKALALAFVKEHSITPTQIAELRLFGQDQLLPDSLKLIAGSAFGIQGLDWIYTADYADGGARATAFVAKRESAAKAQASADTFIAFWNEYGAEPVAAPDHLPSSRIVLILDNYEVAAVEGQYILGVHEASHLDFGLKVVEQLRHAVKEVAK